MPDTAKSKTILIVEDDEGIQEAMRLYLELEGYRVSVAGDGKQALALLSSGFMPRLILLDLMMPIMDGYEFLRIRKADPALLQIPVAIVSAFSGDLPSLNVQGFVGKPIDFDRLLMLIKKYCG